jgi:hypothetical protein
MEIELARVVDDDGSFGLRKKRQARSSAGEQDSDDI